MIYLKNVATVNIEKARCTGCGFCIDVCPRGVLTLREAKAEILEPDACIECGACQRNCAYGAIRVVSGVGCAQALFNALKTGGEPVCDCERSDKKERNCC